MQAARRRVAWARGFPFASAVLFGALSLHPLSDTDLHWHLALGRAVLEARSRVVPEPITLPSFGSTCIVHEWLWDVVLYSVQHRFGWTGVSFLVSAVAILAGLALGLLVTRWTTTPPSRLGTLAVTLLAAPLLLTRINERPESVAMVLWPLGLLAARGLARAPSMASAVPRASLLVLLALFWAQVHLSLVAFVPAAAIVLGPSALGRGPVERLRQISLVLVALCLLTTTPGLLVFTVPSRVSPYIAARVYEWMPFTWAMLDPTDPDTVHGPAYFLLLVLGVVLGWRHRRSLTVEYALAFLGVLIVTRGRRGATPAAVLATPLAIAALGSILSRTIRSSRAWQIVAVFAGLLLDWRFTKWSEAEVGRFGLLGLDESSFPVGTSRLLATVPGEHRALTTYSTGPALAFDSRGRIRTFVDSRTPIFTFDEAEFAAGETTWSHAAALPVATERYGFDVAVVDRSFPICTSLAKSREWVLVLVEPKIAAFARTGSPAAAQPLKRLQPCGEQTIPDAACTEPIADLDAELAREAAFASPAFASYLRADRMLRCATGRFDGDAIAATLPEDATGFEAGRDGILAWLYALAGRRREAVQLVAPHAIAGHGWILRDSLPTLAKGGADEDLRALLQRLVDAAGETADDAYVVALANACARLGDLRCARLEGVRAAAVGRFDVGPALCFVRGATKSPQERADADQWLETLRRGAPPPARPALDCPR